MAGNGEISQEPDYHTRVVRVTLVPGLKEGYKMTFRFVHMADVHLDTPFVSLDQRLRDLLRQALIKAFESAVDLAVERKAQAVLIAGDLFDNETLSFATEKLLLAELHRLSEAGISVYCSPGNHDPFGSGCRAHRIEWPDNMHIFNSCKPQTFPVLDRDGNLVARVTGAGHEGPREGHNLAQEFPPVEGGVPEVALLHALVTGSAGEAEHLSYAPCQPRDLAGKGYCYWALGHIHTRTELPGPPLAVYPGNLVGRDPGEAGPRGVYYVETEANGQVRAAFQPLAPLTWLNLSAGDLSSVSTYAGLEDRLAEVIKDCCREPGDARRLLIRLVLAGPCQLEQELKVRENIDNLASDIKNELEVPYLELVTNQLIRPLHPQSYRGEPHILGAALNLLDTLDQDGSLLLSLAPQLLAGCGSRKPDERLAYLRSLLGGLDYEATARMVEVDDHDH